MKKLVLFMAVALLSSTSVAQRGNTKQQCTRLCLETEFDNPQMAQHAQKLKEIRDKKEAETDPSKRKALEQAESDELDRRQDDQEKMCRHICAPLRDE